MHLRPDRLRAHAAEAADMAEALARLGRAPAPAADPLDTAVARARRELAEVEMSLRSAAAAARASATAASPMRRRSAGLSANDGVSSTTF